MCFDERMSSELAHAGVAMVVVATEPEVVIQGYAELLDTVELKSTAVRNGSIHSVEPQENFKKNLALFEVPDFAVAHTLRKRRGHGMIDIADVDLSLRLSIGPFSASSSSEIGIVGQSLARSEYSEATSVIRDISAIDHLVFTAPSKDRAIALFAGEWDANFRLEQHVSETVSQLFFRRGAIIIEVLVGLDDEVKFWGIAWRSNNIEHSHRRLTEIGMAISEIRVGKKPGTQVFTVRDERLGLKNLIISNK